MQPFFVQSFFSGRKSEQQIFCQLSQHLFTAQNILTGHVFVRFVGQLQVPGAVGPAVVAAQCPGDDGGVRLTGEKAYCRRLSGDLLAGFPQCL